MLENGLSDCHAVKVNFCYLCSRCLVNKLQLRDVSLELQETMRESTGDLGIVIFLRDRTLK